MKWGALISAFSKGPSSSLHVFSFGEDLFQECKMEVNENIREQILTFRKKWRLSNQQLNLNPKSKEYPVGTYCNY